MNGTSRKKTAGAQKLWDKNACGRHTGIEVVGISSRRARIPAKVLESSGAGVAEAVSSLMDSFLVRVFLVADNLKYFDLYR